MQLTPGVSEDHLGMTLNASPAQYENWNANQRNYTTNAEVIGRFLYHRT